MPQIIQWQTTPEQTRAVIQQAIEIADEFFEDGHKWQPVFIQACQMLAPRPIGMQADGPALDLNALKLGRH